MPYSYSGKLWQGFLIWRFSKFGIDHQIKNSPIELTVVSWVSAHGRLNIPRDFGPHGRLPGIKMIRCIEAATVAP